MSGIFMFILFLLNIITIFAVIVLFLRQNRFIQVEKDQRTMMVEMEELMSGYIMEMKEENEALLEKLMNKKQPLIAVEGKESSLSDEAIVLTKKQNIQEELSLPHLHNSSKNKAVEIYKKQSLPKEHINIESIQLDGDSMDLSVDSENQGNNPEKVTFMETLQASLNGQSLQEPSLREQVNSLAKQGLSAEEIAQNLKCGKTEVELLLKFQNGK